MSVVLVLKRCVSSVQNASEAPKESRGTSHKATGFGGMTCVLCFWPQLGLCTKGMLLMVLFKL